MSGYSNLSTQLLRNLSLKIMKNINMDVNMDITRREKDVFKLLIQGKTNKQIALNLKISDYTVRDHVSSLLRKSNVNTRVELIAKYHMEIRQ